MAGKAQGKQVEGGLTGLEVTLSSVSTCKHKAAGTVMRGAVNFAGVAVCALTLPVGPRHGTCPLLTRQMELLPLCSGTENDGF